MKKSRWNENEIEDLLRQLPQVKDTRSKKEVFSEIYTKKRKRRKKQWIPLIAGVASLFLMMIIASSLMTAKEESGRQEVGNDKLAVSESIRDGQQQYDVKSNDEQDFNNLESNQEKETESKSKSQIAKQGITRTSAIYPKDLQDKSTITLGVPDDQQNFIVPISFVVDHFDESDGLSQVVKKMSTIQEEIYGLSDYFPLDIKVTQGAAENIANIELRAGSKLLDEDILFLRMMEETLSYLEIDKMTFTTDGNSGAMFAHAGLLKEEDVPLHKNRTFLLYQSDESSSKFLVPSNMDYQKLEEALQAAKEDPGIEGVSSAIPQDLKWENIILDKDLVTVELAKEVELDDSPESLQALEVILFTAKDFGYKRVKFKNAPIETVGTLNLMEELTVPIAPNQVN